MLTYQWKANSNAAPFFSDPSEGFIEAATPMDALKKVVAEYDHPCGLFSVAIYEPSPENPILARYLSIRAATQAKAPIGLTKWEGDILYVNGKKIPLAEKEVWEDLTQGKKEANP